MLGAVALVAYLIQPGDTLSGIAASHGVSLAAVESANPQLSDPGIIYAGQTVKIPGGSSAAQASSSAQSYAASAGSQSESSSSAPSSVASSDTGTAASSTGTASSTQASSGGSSSSSLSNVPGVPQSFAACVAYRESTNLQNPAANGNAYGIIPASGYNVSGMSLAQQKQVFAQLYQQYGTSPWASDGCA